MAKSYYGRRPWWYYPQFAARGILVFLCVVLAFVGGLITYFVDWPTGLWGFVLLGAALVAGGVAWLFGWRD